MTDHEANNPENTQSPSQQNQSLKELRIVKEIPSDADQAIKQFNQIKTALVGPEPEWCLPRVNEEAKATYPKIDDSVLTRSCNIIG